MGKLGGTHQIHPGALGPKIVQKPNKTPIELNSMDKPTLYSVTLSLIGINSYYSKTMS